MPLLVYKDDCEDLSLKLFFCREAGFMLQFSLMSGLPDD